MKCTAGLAPQRLRFSMSLQNSRPRLEQSTKKIFMENEMRDLSTTLCRGIAWQVLASAPLRVDRSSLGGVFQPMALPEASAPAWGRPRTRISAFSPFRPLGLQRCSPPVSPLHRPPVLLRPCTCTTPPRPPIPCPRLHHPSSAPSSHSQPLLPRPAPCSLIPPTQGSKALECPVAQALFWAPAVSESRNGFCKEPVL